MNSLNNNTLFHSSTDNKLIVILQMLSLASAVIVVLIFAFLIREAWPLLQKIPLWDFFSDPSWHPTQGRYNLLPILMGTIYTTLGAVLLSAPLGIASALFCRFYAPPILAKMYRAIIELLAGIPSVVYGFWGLVVLVPIIAQWQGPGTSVMAGIIVLTLMILPTAALLADAALEKTPTSWIYGSYTLGLTRWAMIRRIAIPTAKQGLVNALLLQTGRAIGETMAVLMVCGNVVSHPENLFEPVRTLSANIALEMAYAMDDHRAALYCSGLLLMVMVAVLVLSANPAKGENLHV